MPNAAAKMAALPVKFSQLISLNIYMNNIIKRITYTAICLAPLTLTQAAEKTAPSTAKYEPTEESLKQAEVPEWFIDGKLGIFMHWGPESIPGVASTWYARWMYEEGSDGYKYHCATYGHPSKFGYKDLCKLFKAEKFAVPRPTGS